MRRMPCRRVAEEGHLPLVQHRLPRLRLLLQHCLPAAEHLVPLALQAWAEGVVAGADAEGLLLPVPPVRPVHLARELHLPAWAWAEAAVVHRQRRRPRACWARSSWWRTRAVLQRSGTRHRSEIEPERDGYKREV